MLAQLNPPIKQNVINIFIREEIGVTNQEEDQVVFHFGHYNKIVF
jgi:hypothetical protein